MQQYHQRLVVGVQKDGRCATKGGGGQQRGVGRVQKRWQEWLNCMSACLFEGQLALVACGGPVPLLPEQSGA